LKFQYVLDAAELTYWEIDVVLEWHADEVADRVLKGGQYLVIVRSPLCCYQTRARQCEGTRVHNLSHINYVPFR
jgi:endo-beta-N-acetylglucosaminidase D